jgi:hypothetical protein
MELMLTQASSSIIVGVTVILESYSDLSLFLTFLMSNIGLRFLSQIMGLGKIYLELQRLMLRIIALIYPLIQTGDIYSIKNNSLLAFKRSLIQKQFWNSDQNDIIYFALQLIWGFI